MSEERLQELRAEYNTNELKREVGYLRKDFEALSLRVNQLERAHNRLCHFVGHATEGNTIDRDMGAKNEMGKKNDSH